jgi:hypothetical protein
MERVEQNFKVFENFLEITPTEAPKTNSIYEIRVKGLKSLKKDKKLDNLKLKVVTKLIPSYCSIEGINTLVDVFDIPEEKLLYYIREASRYADYIKGTAAVKTGEIASFEVEQFVKTKASLDALLNVYAQKASDSGTKGTLGDITFENSKVFGSIKDLIKLLKEEFRKWENVLSGYSNVDRAKLEATKIYMKENFNSDVTANAEVLLNDSIHSSAQEG